MQETAVWYEERKHRSFHNFLEQIWDVSPLMTSVTFAHVLLICGCLIGLAMDGRTILGDPVWIKPLKFAISGAIYCGTITWMLTFIRSKRWIIRTIAIGSSILWAVEIIAITFQASRGVRSHYNLTTPFDQAIFGMMGTAIILLWTINLILIVVLIFQPFKDFAFKNSLVLGLSIAIIGGLLAYTMTSQTTPEQQAALERGETLEFSGGHTFGAEDGGAGLPFVGWSTTHGDMRPAHFIGLHGLQLIPLLGIFINRRWRKFSVGRRTLLVYIGSGAYLGIIYALYQQALNELPITSFDLVTMSIITAVIVVCSSLWYLTIQSGNRLAAEIASA